VAGGLILFGWIRRRPILFESIATNAPGFDKPETAAPESKAG